MEETDRRSCAGIHTSPYSQFSQRFLSLVSHSRDWWAVILCRRPLSLDGSRAVDLSCCSSLLVGPHGSFFWLPSSSLPLSPSVPGTSGLHSLSPHFFFLLINAPGGSSPTGSVRSVSLVPVFASSLIAFGFAYSRVPILSSSPPEPGVS